MAVYKKYSRDGRAPIPIKETTSRIMSSIKSRNTKPELILRRALMDNKVRGYRLHWNKVPGRPDIAFPGKKIAIFVNGCFWHRCPYCHPPVPKSHTKFWEKKFEKNIERDRIKIDLLTNKNWKTIVIWECKLKNDIEECVTTIANLINENN
jgi:DNA mismatch endonuclease, patch repair protein